MREIKFKGKDVKTNEWVYGGYYKHLKRTPSPIGDSIKDSDYEHLIINSGFSDWNMSKPIDCFIVDEKTVGQYTGFKDINETEIYENDVVKLFNNKNVTVIFKNGAFGYTNTYGCTNTYDEFISFSENKHFKWNNGISKDIKVVK